METKNFNILKSKIQLAYKNHKTAERKLRKVIRTRFGKCPRDLSKLVEEPYIEGGDSFYQIIYFNEEYFGILGE